MSRFNDELDGKIAKDLNVAGDFITIFCRERHNGAERKAFIMKDERLSRVLKKKNLSLCPECSKLLQHAAAKLLMCPMDPKPMCKRCTIHCYAPWYRQRMREVMRFSGLYLIKHGRLDMIFHYLF